MTNNKLTIFLANLSHIRDGIYQTETIPLNIGFLGAYLMKKLSGLIELRLFVNPFELEKTVAKGFVPHMLCCSNYAWNGNLNYHYLSYYKKKYPELITVMGGPNYPGRHDLQKKFLLNRPDLDFYVYLEGEETIHELTGAVIDCKRDLSEVRKKKIKGLHTIDKGKLIAGKTRARFVDIEELPSPYLSGLLDKMLLDGMAPMIQTNRGCPFGCAYCHSSQSYYTKVTNQAEERVLSEIDYIAERTTSTLLHIADDNFGIFPQDKKYVEEIVFSMEKSGWPKQVNVSTSKENKKRVLGAIKPLGEITSFSASLQSINRKTLQAINRKNLSFSEYKDVISELKESGVKCLVELIIGLPEETKESFLVGIKQSLDAGLNQFCIYTCMILPNTPLAENEKFKSYALDMRWRVIPNNFGTYLNKKIIEIEKVCVATNALSFDKYIDLRGFSFIVSTFINTGVFSEVIKYLEINEISLYEWIQNIYQEIDRSESVSSIYYEFLREAGEELWVMEEELYNYFNRDDNFELLYRGDAGANLIMKYSLLFINRLREVTHLIYDVTCRKYKLNPEILEAMINYINAARAEVFETDKVIELDMPFDILKWIDDGMIENPESYKASVSLKLFHTPERYKLINELKASYGDNEAGRAKAFSRINPDFIFRTACYAKKGQLAEGKVRF